ncbi:MAG: PEP-CTERM sorting domain-containing protein [Cyanobacteria bacterium P01_H01_bin.35]
MKNKIFASIAAIPFAVGTVLAGATNAQAMVPTGSLAFQDGTSDFFSDVNVGANDTFDVTFNMGSLVFVSTATGDFVPPFVGAFTTEELLTSTASFEYVSGDASGFTYKLTNDLVFDFDNGDNDGNESIVTWLAGTEFEGMFNEMGSDGVEFSLAANQPMPVVTGIGEDVTVIANVFQFGDTQPTGGGSYLAQVDVTSTPEPTALFGLGVVATGLVASRRKKSS